MMRMKYKRQRKMGNDYNKVQKTEDTEVTVSNNEKLAKK